MTLDRLCELAYMCEYVGLDELGEINGFTKTWHDLLDSQLEDLHLSRQDLEEQERDYLSIGGTKARLTSDDIETIRIHLSAMKETLGNQHRWKEAQEYQDLIDRFIAYVSDNEEEV